MGQRQEPHLQQAVTEWFSKQDSKPSPPSAALSHHPDHLLCTESSGKTHRGLFWIAATPGEDKVPVISLLFNYLQSLGQREPKAMPLFFQLLFLFLLLVSLRPCCGHLNNYFSKVCARKKRKNELPNHRWRILVLSTRHLAEGSLRYLLI